MARAQLYLADCPVCHTTHPLLFWPHTQEIVLCKCGSEIGGFSITDNGELTYRILPKARAQWGKGVQARHASDDTPVIGE